MGHLLYLPFYGDRLSIMEGMWEAWCHGCKQAIDILNHIGRNYTIHMENQQVDFSTIVYSFLAHQIRRLVQNASSTAPKGQAGHLILDSLMNTIAIHFVDSNFELADFLFVHHHFQRSTESYGWYDQSVYAVSTTENHSSGDIAQRLFLMD